MDLAKIKARWLSPLWRQRQPSWFRLRADKAVVGYEERAGDATERDLEELPADFAALISEVERLSSELEAARTAVRLKWVVALDTTHLVLIHGGMDLRIAYIKPSDDGQYLWKCCSELFMYKVPTRDDALAAIAHCFPLWKIPALAGGA